MAYLDTHGLSTLWAKVKAWVESKGYTTNTGTITGITMNGASKGTSGVVDLGTVITDIVVMDKVKNGTAAKNAVTSLDLNVAESGYTVLGLVGCQVVSNTNNDSTGVMLRGFYMNSSTTARARIVNQATSTNHDMTITFRVLYIKN